jgi:PBP1b-binding outer membrane lipoprotein LpoB
MRILICLLLLILVGCQKYPKPSEVLGKKTEAVIPVEKFGFAKKAGTPLPEKRRGFLA